MLTDRTITAAVRAALDEDAPLNFAQRMCAVAALTARHVDAVEGFDVRIIDTRKTTPGLSAFEKHAVCACGGHNHRRSLSDAVMVKDNHLAALGGDVTGALRRIRDRVATPPTLR